MREIRKFFIILLVIGITLQLFGVGFFSVPQEVKADFVPNRFIDTTNGTDGSGCGASSGAGACKSIQYFINSATVQAGDVVHVAGGTYVETIHTYLLVGTRVSNVTFLADEGDPVTIQDAENTKVVHLANTLTGVTFKGPFIFDAQANQTSILYMSTTVTNITFDGSTFQGSNLTTAISGSSSEGSIVFQNCTFNGQASSSWVSQQLTSFTFNDCDFTIGNTTPGSYFIYSSGAGITKPIVFDGGTLEITTTNHAFNMNSNASLTIQNTGSMDFHNTVDSYISAIYFPGTYSGAITIKNNADIIYDTLTTKHYLLLVEGGSRTIAVDNNSFTLPATDDEYTGQETYIIRLINQNGFAITNNTFDTRTTYSSTHIYASSSNGLSAGNTLISGNTHYTRSLTNYVVAIGSESTIDPGDNAFDGMIIEHNKIYGSAYYDSPAGSISLHAYLLGYNKKIHFRYNYVNGGGYGVVIKGDGNTDVDYDYEGGVYGNIFINNAICGVLVKGAVNVPIYNNTFYSSDDSAMISDGAFVLIIPNFESGPPKSNFRHSSGISVKNNIFYNQENDSSLTIKGYSEDSYSDSSVTGFISSNNLFFNSSHPISYPDGAMVNVSLSEWQALGFDENSLTADPKFNDLDYLTSVNDPDDIENLRIDATSPAINAGIALPSNTDFNGSVVYTDFFNTEIPAYASPTIGAIEYTDITAPVTSKSISPFSTPDGLNEYYTTSPVITLTVSDNVTNDDGVVIMYHLNEDSDTPYTGQITLEDGEYDLYFHSEDSVGNIEDEQGPFNFKVDTIAPVLTNTSTLATYINDTTPTYNFTADEAQPISYGDCWGDLNATTVGDNTLIFDTLTEGSHSCSLSITDLAGNQSILTYFFTVDTTAPNLTILSPINGLSTSGSSISLIGSVTDTNPGSTLKINGASISNPSSFSVSGTLSYGENTFVFVATDAAGNLTTRTITVTRHAVAVNTETNDSDEESEESSETNSSPIQVSTTPSQVVPSLELFDSKTNSSVSASNNSINTINTQTPTFKGKTLPYATVILEIHSDPLIAQVLADKDGNWEYTPTTPLALGEHTVKITIKAKDTNETIGEGTYGFNIVGDEASATTNTTNHNYIWLYIVGGLVVVTIVLIFLLKRKK